MRFPMRTFAKAQASSPVTELLVILGVTYLWPAIAVWQGGWLLIAFSREGGLNEAADAGYLLPILFGAFAMLALTTWTAWALRRDASRSLLILPGVITAMCALGFVFLSFVSSGLGGTMSPETATEAMQQAPRRRHRFATLALSGLPAVQAMVILAVLHRWNSGPWTRLNLRPSLVVFGLIALGMAAKAIRPRDTMTPSATIDSSAQWSAIAASDLPVQGPPYTMSVIERAASGAETRRTHLSFLRVGSAHLSVTSPTQGATVTTGSPRFTRMGDNGSVVEIRGNRSGSLLERGAVTGGVWAAHVADGTGMGMKLARLSPSRAVDRT